MVKTKSHPLQKKRYGHHHRRGRRYLKTYLPYLPLVATLAVSLIIGALPKPGGKTLAYATDMSINGLLSATNNDRLANGQAALSLNQKLINAAQAKANDMVARNYWSHNTPDGQPPWIFINDAGYSYNKAGENLAYGFTTSRDTVTGWMNSPSHRANMLDSAFSEVGFGFANGSNYNNSGQQTVVVAMYGQPAGGSPPPAAAPAAPAPPPPPAAPAAPAPAPPVVVRQPPRPSPPAGDKTAQPTGTSAPLTAPPPETPATQTPAPDNKPPTARSAPPESIPASTQANKLPVGTRPVTIGQLLTAGKVPGVSFGLGLIGGLAAVLWLSKHTLALARALTRGERLLLRHIHHPLLDSLLLSGIIISLTYSRTVGWLV